MSDLCHESVRDATASCATVHRGNERYIVLERTHNMAHNKIIKMKEQSVQLNSADSDGSVYSDSVKTL